MVIIMVHNIMREQKESTGDAKSTAETVKTKKRREIHLVKYDFVCGFFFFLPSPRFVHSESHKNNTTPAVYMYIYDTQITSYVQTMCIGNRHNAYIILYNILHWKYFLKAFPITIFKGSILS